MKYTIRLPAPYPAQRPFLFWNIDNPDSQVLIAPCGTKVGKSFGSALWLATEAISNPNLYCIWIGPTYLKCKIGYRYIKSFCPIGNGFKCVDGLLEVRLPNGSFIKFLHGSDAEVTVEGEGVDRFVVDESGKQDKQLWYSLFTTITQTRGKGIVTGTPRGFNWYYDEFRKAKQGDPFYTWTQLETEQSPYVKPKAIEQAKRLLPKALFDQYYRARFVSMSTVFGDISTMFDESLKVNPGCKFWIHPNGDLRKEDTVTGWDIAKHRDYSVFMTFDFSGRMLGYARFQKINYEIQVDRLKHYMHNYFQGDRILKYDATGIGDAVGEMIADKDIDASITPVIFSNKSKQVMVSRATMAIECGFPKCPRIEQIEHEFGSYEVNVTKTGLFSYSAPDGEHDDCVSAGIMAISSAYQNSMAESAEKMLEELVSGSDEMEYNDGIDEFDDAAEVLSGEDDFFDEDKEEETMEGFSFD